MRDTAEIPPPPPTTTSRLREPPIRLIRKAMGDGPTRRRKLLNLALALRSYGDERQVLPRLQRLKELGWLDQIPTRIQRMVGAIDMLRFFIIPCAADYYRSKGINFYFHTLLRFLDDPASLIDPTGFNSARDTIIGHVLQVVHANPDYDLQLLDSFPDGLHAMEEQVVAILGGTHPRAASILATVEDPEYHGRLLDYVREFRRRQPMTASLLRDNILSDDRFRVLERTFGELPRAMRYFSKLPTSPLGAARHLLSVREFPLHLAEAAYTAAPAQRGT
ncbi:hypothetical protein [Nannocystis radixulma]|uniref:Uncharacterized protein n=1 Tax=Nannocystis radixulma TaxID=2995305 RepID=A0ABT5AXN7_9BACT|nr:hypothetical protein [Nannocystis radixulma]MDC0666609.1 hypothetical protein [Nannocystis radixulma]